MDLKFLSPKATRGTGWGSVMQNASLVGRLPNLTPVAFAYLFAYQQTLALKQTGCLKNADSPSSGWTLSHHLQPTAPHQQLSIFPLLPGLVPSSKKERRGATAFQPSKKVTFWWAQLSLGLFSTQFPLTWGLRTAREAGRKNEKLVLPAGNYCLADSRTEKTSIPLEKRE